ncbi:N(2)-acetyl-L-2,4-diaminobutanoate deacetylase DoeB2 [Hydrogenovibrio sp. 3SP14C1]|uniref:N(2)-acetyl-L-2,4-diaminobutanoate deacetylase DoeB2 n=1 Tax=Hydrogenovibrio sp. 3SP14C1 TaxID=3038774 RepID=UPI0024162D1D|nr:N(2)-acetyl-L-2,4-diaminobutanoate deacetylase DoeB2 [Hydrogenovibrio sp. 3SP14C1]MDG4813207.1 N(2)-acetyl-L-2,4-diaminobutanoate deacetylase DoeB2 [Hydrogenovibrio sp. 3SP14C1]
MTKSWQAILEKAIISRHWLHQHPELTWEEIQTADYIRAQLTELDIAWRACAQFGTVATLAPKAAGPHIAFRADMDALPITEASGVDYCSTESGKMHACGHDGHTATLLAAAAWFKQNESLLSHPISLLFQPAEEGGHGAKKMIEDGALNGIDYLYGWHNWPALPFGKALCPDGPVMSGNGTFHITLKGKGGHASQPEVAHDPVLAAAAVTMNLQQIVSRRLPPQANAVVSVTSINAISNVTVIPDKVKLEGSIRLSQPQWRAPINQLIEEITEATAKSYGVVAEVENRARYEATINHAVPAADYRAALQAEFGEEATSSELLMPLMASEDFSYYLNAIPGAFALVGMAEDSEKGQHFSAPCHSPEYVFNDRVIKKVVKVFSRLAGAPVPN